MIVVIDNPENLGQLTDAVWRAAPGKEIRAVAAGPAALDAVRQAGVELVVAEYRTRGVGGLDVAAECELHGVPVALVSASKPLSAAAARLVKDRASVEDTLVNWLRDPGALRQPARSGLRWKLVALLGVALLLG